MGLQKAKNPPKLEKVPHNKEQQAISGYNKHNLNGLSLRWSRIGKYQLGLNIQTDNYWFGSPGAPHGPSNCQK
jgi:hypothetical protein